MPHQELFMVIRLGMFSIVSIMLGLAVAIGLHFVRPQCQRILQLQDGYENGRHSPL
jgi:hypothetical protein